MIRSFACLLVLGAAFGARTARAETPTAPATVAAPTKAPGRELTRAQLVRALRDRSPRAALRRAQVDVARSELVVAEAAPNPNLAYSALIGLHDVGYVNGTQHQITLSQPVMIAGQRGARRHAARLGVKAATAQAQADLATACHDARITFINLLAAQERVAVLGEALADLERARSIVAGRAQSGMMSRYDVTKLDVEKSELQGNLALASADRDDLAGHLATQSGLDYLPIAVGDLATAAGDRAPAPGSAELLALRESTGAATARIDVARRERVPTPVLAAGAQLTSSGFTVAASLGVSMDLPLFDTGKGAVARASAEAEEARQREATARAELGRELNRARATLESKRQALARFEQEVVVSLPELRRMSEDAYAAGQGTSLDLLDALRTVSDARTSHVDYQEQVALAVEDVLFASGQSASDLP